MKTLLVFSLLLISFSSTFATKYYSIADGDWGTNTTWSLTNNGPASTTSPNNNDDVVISHLVTHNTGGTYIHNGDVKIEVSGEYQINTGYGSGNYYLFKGSSFDVYGKLWTSSDFHHQQAATSGNGLFSLQEGSIVSIGDDLILNAYSRTIMNTVDCGYAQVVDDIYFVGTNSQMCGQGHFIVPDMLRAWNDANKEVFPAISQYENQLCNGFSLYANIIDCENDNPIVTGTGPFDLPVEYLSFEVYWSDKKVAIEWETANEQQNDFFTVERSIDGKFFQSISSVPGSGTTQSVTSYSALDNRPVNGIAYYRLKQTDFDGTSSYSNILELEFKAQTPILVLYPNPVVSDHINISGLDSKRDYEVALFDLQGVLVKQYVSASSLVAERKITIPNSLNRGMYILNITSENFSYTQKLDIQ